MSDAALYQTLKSVHIILVTSWFAGLFYLPRLLVYHAEAQDKPELEKTILSKQFEKMEKILFNAIMIPAFWLTWISGISLIYLVWWDSFGQQPWLHLKLAFVVCITIYHFYCRHLIRSFRNQNFILSGKDFFRKAEDFRKNYFSFSKLFLDFLIIINIFRKYKNNFLRIPEMFFKIFLKSF